VGAGRQKGQGYAEIEARLIRPHHQLQPGAPQQQPWLDLGRAGEAGHVAAAIEVGAVQQPGR
jgi:hypothetical protein